MVSKRRKTLIKLSKNRVNLWSVLLAVVFMVIQVIATLNLPNLTSDMVNLGIAKGDNDYIMQAGMKMLVVTLISVIAAICNVYFAARISQGFGEKLRSAIFSKVLNMSLTEYGQVGTASMITRTTNDVNQIQNVSMMALRMMIQAPIMLIGASIMAYNKESRLTSVFLVAIPVLIVVVGVVMYFATPLFKSLQGKTDKLNLIFREGLTGVRVIRSFRQDDFEQVRFDGANTDYTSTAKKVFSLVALMFPLMTLIMSGTNIAITWQGAHLIGNMDMQVGNLIAFITYAMQILMSFMMLSMVFFLVPRAQASASRISELLDSKNELIPAADPKQIADKPAALEFDNVDFFYPKASVAAVKNVTAQVKQGETLAIIGGTGAGKTTLLNLIPRFFDVTNGAVKVNGVNVKDVTKQDLQAQVSLAPQKAVLFKGTIRDNLLFGKADATDAEMWRALDIAQASEFVKDLDGQLDAEVEQNGDNFSGGQRQRLSIARALIKEADLYLFDDSFSALDFKTDANLRQALKDDEVMQKKIVVIVGQRVSTVASADQIIVLNEGEMVGLGTHEYLKAENKTYQEIVKSQIREEDQDGR